MTDKALPGQKEQPEGIMCHNCGRFVGPLNRCPYCGATIHKRMSVRFFRVAALLIAVLGVGLLWLMVLNRNIPVIKIEQIGPTMNFALVRIQGVAAGDARIFRKGDKVQSVSFAVDDGTGEIDIKAYRAKARELVERGLVPRGGDKVEAVGSLNVGAERMAVWLAGPDQLKIEHEPVQEITLSQVDDSLVGNNVKIHGVILKVTTPKLGTRAPWGIQFTDGTAVGRLTLWQSTYDELADKSSIQSGRTFEAIAQVTTYRDKIQYKLNRGTDLTLLKDSPADIVARADATPGRIWKPGEITPDQVGRVLKARGVLSRYYVPRKGSRAQHKLIVGEGEALFAVSYGPGVAKELPDGLIRKGAAIEVEGLVQTNQYGILFRVYSPSQIRAIKP